MAVNYRMMNCEPRHVFDVLANGWVYPTWVVGASRMRERRCCGSPATVCPPGTRRNYASSVWERGGEGGFCLVRPGTVAPQRAPLRGHAAHRRHTRPTRPCQNTVSRGQHAEHPYVLASQPTVLDPSRAPAGKHVLWAYTHVPHGSSVDQAETVTRQIERYAPDFRDTILAVSSRTAVQVEDENPNYVGGDIAARPESRRATSGQACSFGRSVAHSVARSVFVLSIDSARPGRTRALRVAGGAVRTPKRIRDQASADLAEEQ